MSSCHVPRMSSQATASSCLTVPLRGVGGPGSARGGRSNNRHGKVTSTAQGFPRRVVKEDIREDLQCIKRCTVIASLRAPRKVCVTNHNSALTGRINDGAGRLDLRQINPAPCGRGATDSAGHAGPRTQFSHRHRGHVWRLPMEAGCREVDRQRRPAIFRDRSVRRRGAWRLHARFHVSFPAGTWDRRR